MRPCLVLLVHADVCEFILRPGQCCHMGVILLEWERTLQPDYALQSVCAHVCL